MHKNYQLRAEHASLHFQMTCQKHFSVMWADTIEAGIGICCGHQSRYMCLQSSPIHSGSKARDLVLKFVQSLRQVAMIPESTIFWNTWGWNAKWQAAICVVVYGVRVLTATNCSTESATLCTMGGWKAKWWVVICAFGQGADSMNRMRNSYRLIIWGLWHNFPRYLN